MQQGPHGIMLPSLLVLLAKGCFGASNSETQFPVQHQTAGAHFLGVGNIYGPRNYPAPQEVQGNVALPTPVLPGGGHTALGAGGLNFRHLLQPISQSGSGSSAPLQPQPEIFPLGQPQGAPQSQAEAGVPPAPPASSGPVVSSLPLSPGYQSQPHPLVHLPQGNPNLLQSVSEPLSRPGAPVVSSLNQFPSNPVGQPIANLQAQPHNSPAATFPGIQFSSPSQMIGNAEIQGFNSPLGQPGLNIPGGPPPPSQAQPLALQGGINIQGGPALANLQVQPQGNPSKCAIGVTNCASASVGGGPAGPAGPPPGPSPNGSPPPPGNPQADPSLTEALLAASPPIPSSQNPQGLAQGSQPPLQGTTSFVNLGGQPQPGPPGANSPLPGGINVQQQPIVNPGGQRFSNLRLRPSQLPQPFSNIAGQPLISQTAQNLQGQQFNGPIQVSSLPPTGGQTSPSLTQSLVQASQSLPHPPDPEILAKASQSLIQQSPSFTGQGGPPGAGVGAQPLNNPQGQPGFQSGPISGAQPQPITNIGGAQPFNSVAGPPSIPINGPATGTFSAQPHPVEESQNQEAPQLGGGVPAVPPPPQPVDPIAALGNPGVDEPFGPPSPGGPATFSEAVEQTKTPVPTFVGTVDPPRHPGPSGAAPSPVGNPASLTLGGVGSPGNSPSPLQNLGPQTPGNPAPLVSSLGNSGSPLQNPGPQPLGSIGSPGIGSGAPFGRPASRPLSTPPRPPPGSPGSPPGSNLGGIPPLSAAAIPRRLGQFNHGLGNSLGGGGANTQTISFPNIGVHIQHGR